MSEKDTRPIIDADSHILEPSDLWQKYLEPKYRDRALRLEKDDQGWDQWVIDGIPWGYRHGVFGDMGAIGRDLEPHFTPGVVSYEEGIAFAPGAGTRRSGWPFSTRRASTRSSSTHLWASPGRVVARTLSWGTHTAGPTTTGCWTGAANLRTG